MTILKGSHAGPCKRRCTMGNRCCLSDDVCHDLCICEHKCDCHSAKRYSEAKQREQRLKVGEQR